MVKLPADDIDFLLQVLELPPGIVEDLARARLKDGLLEEDDADILRDLCGERLQTHGFGPDYEPNRVGRRLERLIDKLFVG